MDRGSKNYKRNIVTIKNQLCNQTWLGPWLGPGFKQSDQIKIMSLLYILKRVMLIGALKAFINISLLKKPTKF